MANIKFQCSGCRKAVNAPAAMAGRPAKCPYCSMTITIPALVPTIAIEQEAKQPTLLSRPQATNLSAANCPAVEHGESPGLNVSEASEELEHAIPKLMKLECELLASFRRYAREYEAAEQAERNRHTEFEQAKRKEMEESCARLARLLQDVTAAEHSLDGSRARFDGAGVERRLYRNVWAPTKNSVRAGPVHGSSEAELSRALTGCSQQAQDKLRTIQSLPTIIKVTCIAAFILSCVVLGGWGAGAAVTFIGAVAVTIGSYTLGVFAGCGMFRALFKAVKTAEAIADRWRKIVQTDFEAEIEKSSEQTRNTLARQLDSWRQLLLRLQDAERVAVVKGDKYAPTWDDPMWKQWKPSEKKPPGIRLGNYFLRANLPTGDYASLSVPAIIPFPGERSLMFITDSRAVAVADQKEDLRLRRYDLQLNTVGKTPSRVLSRIRSAKDYDKRRAEESFLSADERWDTDSFPDLDERIDEVELARRAPCVIWRNISQEVAERWGNVLMEAGATVSIRPHQEIAEQPDALQLRAARIVPVQVMRSIATQLLATIPPGKVQFTFIDPIGLGDSFAQFMDIKKYDDDLVSHRVWTEPRQIEQQLADLTQHMEDVIQMYLRNRYPTIEDYNKKAGEIAEPYRVLMVADFPANFNEEAARRLVSIATNGPRCGVFAVIGVDTEKKLPYDFSLASLERVSTVLSWKDNGFILQDSEYEHCGLQPDTSPEASLLSHVIHEIGVRSKDAKQVQVPFQFIAVPEDRWWTQNCCAGITIPLGKSGATDQHRLELGSGTALHALICGKTGSGKTTLLHVLITNLALAYSPEELDLYLIDFKKGVEFKRYASFELPHARVIAIETEREFGLSVLHGLNEELKRRGDLFRQNEVQNITAYREKYPKEHCPRILLIVDEFQEFFVSDDQTGQEAALVLDRLVRQGRAFGIHVILGTQTLAGAYSLARSTIDQMAIRIALQCSDADSRLILSDENSAARLLCRPGDAIYNNANGLVEGNIPFQVTWLTDEESENYLSRIREFTTKRGWKSPRSQIVFEGNAPAIVEKNQLLHTLLSSPRWPVLPKAIPAWMGEPIAIKDPTAAIFRRQAASNLIFVGQNEEAVLNMMITMAVSLAAQHDVKTENSRARFYTIDLTPADRPVAGKLKEAFGALPHCAQVAGRRDIESVIREVATQVKERLEDGEATTKEAVYLFIYGLQRARDLRQDDQKTYYGDNDEEPTPNLSEQFQMILREGPELGIHTIAWCDNWGNLDRILVRGLLREFDMRVAFQMSADDSSNLLDTPLASKLGQHRALFVTDEEGKIEKFRPYGWSDGWLDNVRNQFRAKEDTGLVTSAE